MSPESVADLVDLEQELSSIQRGITQMERITPNEPPTKPASEDDPFGDSFTHFPVIIPESIYCPVLSLNANLFGLFFRHIIYCHRQNHRNLGIRNR